MCFNHGLRFCETPIESFGNIGGVPGTRCSLVLQFRVLGFGECQTLLPQPY